LLVASYQLRDLKPLTFILKVMMKTMDSATATADRLECCVLLKEGEKVREFLVFSMHSESLTKDIS
jgi:hypothetical protein